MTNGTSPASFLKRLLILSALLILGLHTGCSPATKEKGILPTPTVPEDELMGSAMDLYDRGLFEASSKLWLQLKDDYPGSPYLILIELKYADALFFSNNYPEALSAYEDFIRNHPGHEAVPYVRYQIAAAHLDQYRGEKYDQEPIFTAIKLFEKLATDYPLSEYSTLARRKVDLCRSLLAKHEAYVADFYLRQGKVTASAERYATLKELYPESKTPEELENQLKETYPEELHDLERAVVKRERREIKQGVQNLPLEPKAPEILLSAIVEQPKPSTRSAPPEILSEQSLVTDNNPNLPTLVLDSKCNAQEESEVFIITLAEPVKFLRKLGERENLVRRDFQTSSRAFQPVSKVVESCKDSGARMGVVVQPVAQGTLLVVRVLNPPEKQVKMLIVDRPNRLIFVVE